MFRALTLAGAVLLPAFSWADEKPARSIAGHWLGTLKVGVIELRLGIHIEKKPDGTLTATVDSIDQGAAGVKTDSATFADNKLTLKMPGQPVFGTLQPDGDTIKGDLVQKEIRLPWS